MKIPTASVRWPALIAVGLLAACGSGATLNAAPAGNGRAAALRGVTSGELTKISGGTLTVAARAGDVTVTTSSATKVTATTAASLSDVTGGDCVSVSGPTDSGGNLTATTINITGGTSGSCSVASIPGLGGGRGGGSSQPGAAGGPGGGSGFGLTRTPRSLGTVSDVTTTGFTLREASGTSVQVTTSPSTTVTRASTESVSSLKTGVCVVVLGHPQSSSEVAAATIAVTPAGANGCSRGFGGGGGGFGGGGGGFAGGAFGGGSSGSGAGAPAVGI
jgi:Domain of unknown function (DUF5666)